MTDETQLNGDSAKSAPAGVDDAGSGATAIDTLTAITAERDSLAMEKAEMQDRLLRAQAEFQNFQIGRAHV